MTIYTPFGHSDWREIVGKIKTFGSAGTKTAVISTINGDANMHFYRELAAQSVDAATIPVMALSVGERELVGLDVKSLRASRGVELLPVGQIAGKRSVRQECGTNSTGNAKEPNDPMEATFVGFRMWAQAVAQAGTTDVDAVRQAMYGRGSRRRAASRR